MNKIWEESKPWIDCADADVDLYVDKYRALEIPNLREALVNWRDKGIVIFRDVISVELVEALKSDIDYLIKNHHDFDLLTEVNPFTRPINEYQQSELLGSRVKFNSIHSISEAAIRLSLSKFISSFLHCIFDAPPAVLQSLTFFKGSQQPIHIDYPYVRTQKKIAHLAASWIPLEDIHPDSGPLAYYPGSHKTEISSFFDWGNGSILMNSDSQKTPIDFAEYLEGRVKMFGIEPEIYCPKKGDVLLWHGNLMHAGTRINNDNLTRKSYVTHYTSLNSYPDDFRVWNEDRCLISNGGYCFEYPWVLNSPKLPSWSI